MDHTKVESSHISSVAFDEKSETLEIKFKEGSTYRYAGVSKERYEKMMASESIGEFFHKFINHRHKSIKL